MLILGSLESAYGLLIMDNWISLFSLDVTAEMPQAIICSKSAISLQSGPVEQKFQVEGVTSHQLFFFLEKNKVKWSFVAYGI